MRNLKRALSAALASVMVLGLMVVGASAASYEDFTDKAEITHKEAVSMVTELGIIAGLTDGSYGPAQNIDRASFARLICVALNGGKEPTLGNLKTSFTDTQGNWAEKYIAYCVQMGIIAGKGNNTFAPSANVTGSEAAKMLLVAVGYNTSFEGIGGATWQLSTDVLANSVGLYDGLEDINTSSALTRDQAAQMLYNALNVEMVKYEIGPGVSVNGQLTANTQRVGTGETLLNKAFKADKVEGVVMANEYGSGDYNAAAGKTKIGEKTYSVSTSVDMLGKSVVLYVGEKNGKTVIFGNPIVSDDCVSVTATKAFASADEVAEFLDDNDLSGTGAVILNGAASESAVESIAGAGVETTFIDNYNDGTVDYVNIVKKTVSKVDAYSTRNDGSLRLNGVKDAIDAEDAIGFENVAKDDVVLYVVLNGKYYVEKSESVDVTIDALRSDEVRADGTTYKLSGVTGATDTLPSLGDEVTLYLDNYGNIVKTSEIESESNYALVLEADVTASGSLNSNRAVLVFADGTKYIVDVDRYRATSNGDNADLSIEADGTPIVVSYTVTSDGDYRLVDANASGLDGDYTKGDAKLDSKTVNSKTVAVVKSGDNWKVYTGIRNIPTMDNITGYAVLDDTTIELVFITANDDATTDGDPIYVLGNVVTTGTSDEPVYTYDVIYKGEVTTMVGQTDGIEAGYYSDIALNGDGEFEIAEDATAAEPVAVTAAGNGVLETEAEDGAYSYDDNTVFFLIDGDTIDDVDDTVGADYLAAGDKVIVTVDRDDNVLTYVYIIVE